MTSRALINQYVGCIVDGGMTSDDIEAHALPFYHCAQLHCFLTVDVYLGATSIVLPGPDPALLLATIERYGVTKLFCPPTVWIALLRHPDFDTTDLSSLRKAYYGASAMPAEVLRELAERLPDVALRNFYGQTEMAPLATILQPHEQLTHIGSAGRASLNVQTRIVDDDGQPRPAGDGRRDRPPQPAGHDRLLERPRADRRGVRRRLVPLRRPRRDGRRRLPRRRRPQEGHDQERRRERRQPRGRGGDVRAPGRGRGRRVRHPPPLLGRGRHRRRRDQAGRHRHRRRAARARPRPAGPLQGPEVRRARRRAAEEPERQDPQARPARDVPRPRPADDH